MYNIWKDIGLFVGSFLFIIGLVFAAVLTLTNHDIHVECLRFYETTGIETKVVGTVSPTCFVNTPKGWVPLDNWYQNRVE